MPVWKPPKTVGQMEVVGRRLLDKKGVERPKNEHGRPFFEVGDFHETREREDFSVDRLGDVNPSKVTIRAITKIADTAASEQDRVFGGWATIRVRDFRFQGWVADIAAAPTHNDDGTVDNQWHANVSKDDFRKKSQAYTFAVTLQQTFERKGGYRAPERS